MGQTKACFVSSRWAAAQRIMSNTTNKGNATTNWSKFFVKQILHISWTMWIYRNEALHGVNQKEVRDEHLHNLGEQVDVLYMRAQELRIFNKDEIDVVFK